MPETVFEADDAIFVVVGEEQAPPLIETQQLIELPQLDERQRHEALQEVGAAEIMLAPESKLIGKALSELEFRSRYQVTVLAVRHRGEPLTTNLAETISERLVAFLAATGGRSGERLPGHHSSLGHHALNNLWQRERPHE